MTYEHLQYSNGCWRRCANCRWHAAAMPQLALVAALATVLRWKRDCGTGTGALEPHGCALWGLRRPTIE